MSDERLHILSLVESGDISVEEGVRRLERVPDAESAEASPEAGGSAPVAEGGRPGPEFPMPRLVQVAWQVVFGVGVAVLAGGGLLLARAYGREGTLGPTWGWVVFVLGLLVLLWGWWLQRARWFYLRVREHDGAAFTVALPLPLGLVVGVLRVAEPFFPQLQDVEADQLILAMRDELENERSFAISVDEGEDGDQVELYFC
jgi:hypothetical protein